MHDDPGSLIEPTLRIARDAGQKILEIYRSDFDIEVKADQSPLTAADRAAHQCICKGLARLTPDIPVWSEESAAVPYAQRVSWDEFWLVDPLDGTREFIKRNGEFTVNIALVQNHEPVLGVVHVPAMDKDYYGCRGKGAFVTTPGTEAQMISVEKTARTPVRVVGSRSHRGNSLEAYLADLDEHQMVPMGSSLKLCLVAEGEADVYPRLGPTSEWDTAAAQAVVECAGGRVVDLDGAPIRYNTKEEVLNPYFIVFGDVSRNWTRYGRPRQEAGPA